MRQTKNYGWNVVQRTDGRPDIEQVTNVFDSIDEKVKQLDDKDTFVSNKVNEIDGKLTQTSQKVTELAGAVTQAETKITTLDGRVTGLENATIEIATVEEAIAGERNDIAMSPYTTKQAHYAWGGGGRGNVFIRSKSTNSFTANTETTTFTISDFKDTYMIELIFKNLSPVEDVDYRLNRLTGEVTLLTFSLKTGDTIYYNIFDTKAQVFKSGQKQGEFVAKEEIGTFTIPDFNNEKQATLIFDGLVLLENNEYTITNQGVVTLLNWTLKIGEKITYLIETTSYDYNELSNKPAIPTVDVDKAYVDNKVGDTTALQTTNKTNLVSAVNELKKDKIDRSQIKNNLTETNAGSVLDASQGKVLKDDINTRALKTEVGTLSGLTTTVKSSIVNAINEVSGYIGELQSLATNAKTSVVEAVNENTNGINDLSSISFKFKEDLNKVDIKTITQSGIYRLISCTNAPCSYGVLEVTNLTGNLHYTVIDTINNEMYIMTRRDIGEWTEWQQIATTTKTDILFPYNSGYTTQATHIRNGIVVENNHIYVYINVRKLDGSDVAAGSTIGILPPNCRPDKEIWGTIYLRDYTACYVIITPDGKVIIGGTTDSQYFIGCIDYYI